MADGPRLKKKSSDGVSTVVDYDLRYWNAKGPTASSGYGFEY